MKLIKYDAARQALQVAVKIDDAKNIKDQAEALEIYARQRNDVEMEKWVSEIKLRAHVRIGEISAKLEKITPEESGSMAHTGLPNGGKTSKSAILKAAGISTSSAYRDEMLAYNKEKVEEYITKKASEGKPVKITEAISAVSSNAREEKAKKTLQENPFEIPTGLHAGDFREFAKIIPDDSIELIFTDPPYDRSAIPLFGDLAEIAARILRPGGSLISYCGQIQLPEVLPLMGEYLRYWWINACIHSGGANQMNKYGIKNLWKPIIWFVKGSRGDVQTFIEDTVSGGKEKSHHKWQQAKSEAAYYIERLCSPNGVVFDPFAGGGTTLAACNELNRKWLASEIDPLKVSEISKRLLP